MNPNSAAEFNTGGVWTPIPAKGSKKKKARVAPGAGTGVSPAAAAALDGTPAGRKVRNSMKQTKKQQDNRANEALQKKTALARGEVYE
jgi:hypothetical protein